MLSKMVLEHSLVRQKVCALPYTIALVADSQQVSSFKNPHFIILLNLIRVELLYYVVSRCHQASRKASVLDRIQG